MKNIIFKQSYWSSLIVFLLISLSISTSSKAQLSLEVTSGLLLEASGGIQLEVSGDWQNQGTLTPGLSTLSLDGTGNQNLLNTGGSFYNVTIDKTGGEVFLGGDIFVNTGTFSILTGDVDLNGYLLTLDATASISETAGNTIKGSVGYITTTRNLNNPTADNVAGMGLEITSATDLGNTEIRRGHAAQSGNGATSILRYFEILPNPSGDFSADIVFYYDESELNGQNEADLQLFRSDDDGLNWTLVGGTINEDNNSVTAIGLTEFSRFTLSTGCMETTSITQAFCKDFPINLDDNGTASIAESDIDDGSVGACGIAALSLDISNFDCQHIGDNTVTLTVQGNDGTSDACTATVTVIDDIAPEVNCAAGVVLLDENGQASFDISTLIDGSDNCTSSAALIASAQVGVVTFDCSNIGSNSFELTVTDGSNNQASCTTQIIVEDWLNPVLTEPIEGITAECSITLTPPTGIDNCDGLVTATTDDPLTYDEPGTYFVTWGFEGGGSIFGQLVTIIDEAPTALCQDITVQLDASGQASVTASDIDNGSSDACGIQSLAVSPNTFDCSNIGDNTVTLTVTDTNGNTGTCQSTVTVGDMDQRLSPVLEGLTFNPSTGLFEACFGYLNDNPCTVTVPVSGDNKFTPTTDLGQPTEFIPGRQVSVFCVDLAPGETIVWTLKGPDGNTRTATASAPQATLVTHVWDDKNGNGKQDSSEPGIADAAVELINGFDGTVIQAVTTNTNGEAVFADLGAYDGTQVKLKFYENTDHRFTLKDKGSNDNIDSDANRTNGLTAVFTLDTDNTTTKWDCGLWSPGSVEAYVWDDQNGNGKQDGDEPSISGVEVKLLEADGTTELGITTTNDQGIATFSDVPADRSVMLQFFELADYRFSLKDQGSNDNIDSDANRTNGKTGTFQADRGAQAHDKMDAGLWSPGSVQAYVWDDQNGNGKQDTGEPALAGVQVDLLESDDTFVATTLTNDQGIAIFSNIPANRPMKLQFFELDDYRFTLKDKGSNDNIDSDANRTNGKTATFQASSGAQVHTTMDAGLWSPGSVQAYVWDDQNGNGKQDTGEPAISGVEVKLLEADGTTALGTTTTDADGIATFSAVPADRPVMLQFFELDDYRFTLKDKGSNDNIDSDANRTNGKTATFQASSGAQVHTTMDAGLWSPGSVQAYVWDDQNGNGKQDASEPALEGITVHVLENDGSLFDKTDTDANGIATITGIPADRPFKLQFFEPADLRLTLKDQGSNENIDSDASRTNGITGTFQASQGAQLHEKLDAGMWTPGTVEAFVWDDLNGNGKQDANELGLEGVTVDLLESNGDLIGTTTSDATGLATLTDVPADRPVKLQFGALAGYERTLKDQGSNDNIDSDPNRTNGMTATFEANRGKQTFTTWDAGYISTAGSLATQTEEEEGERMDEAIDPSISGEAVLESSNPKQADFTIFPNPTKDIVNLNLQDYLNQRVTISIYNQAGQPVLQQELGEVIQTTIQFNVSDLPAGHYLIELRTAKERQTKRLIISGF